MSVRSVLVVDPEITGTNIGAAEWSVVQLQRRCLLARLTLRVGDGAL
jgi:hypothetical protein